MLLSVIEREKFKNTKCPKIYVYYTKEVINGIFLK